MLTQKFRIAALAVAAGGLTLASPAAAVPAAHAQTSTAAYGDLTSGYGDRYDRYDRYDRREARRYERDQRRYARQQQWRGDDGRYYCRKSDGTTGLIVGGAAGALLGREVAGRGDKTLGAILGAAGGAILGKSIDSKVTCR